MLHREGPGVGSRAPLSRLTPSSNAERPAPNAGSRPGRQVGFTLLELIIVIAVIGILATIVLPRMKDIPRRAAEAALKTDLRTMRDAIDQYHGDKGHYPTSLQALVEDGYLRSIPRDPITKSKETWIPEYEEFDPDARPAETDLPETGEPGIIDVHSGSELLSLDGEAYSEW